jgi:hypothetical protein
MKSVLIEVYEAFRLAEIVDVVCVPCTISLTTMIVDSFLFMSSTIVVNSQNALECSVTWRWSDFESQENFMLVFLSPNSLEECKDKCMFVSRIEFAFM